MNRLFYCDVSQLPAALKYRVRGEANLATYLVKAYGNCPKGKNLEEYVKGLGKMQLVNLYDMLLPTKCVSTIFVGGAVLLAGLSLGLPVVAAVALAVCAAATEYYTGVVESTNRWVGSTLSNLSPKGGTPPW